MPYLVALLGIVGAAAFWYYRLRQTGEMLGDLAEAANDVRAAARRFGFNRKRDVHPADSLDDPRIAGLGVALAHARLDGDLSRPEIEMSERQAIEKFSVSASDAREMVALARWIAQQCGTADNGVYRLTRRVRALAGTDIADDLIDMARKVAAADGREEGERETASVAQMLRLLRA